LNTNEIEPLFAEERKQKILEIVKRNKKVTVPELCNFFNVSGATIRNDLRDLENARLLKRTHGGAMLNTKTGFELDSKHKEVQNLTEKLIIAELAIELIEDGDTIILDTGTTTLELAKKLKDRKNITAVTNDLEIAKSIETFDGVSTVFLGGNIRRNFHCTLGPAGIRMLSELTVDKAFMGVNGISVLKGATTPDVSHAETKKAMVATANKVIILSDSSKIGKNSFAQFATIHQIETIVTENIEDHFKKEFDMVGIEVVTPQQNPRDHKMK
jgi:DeoR family fructose operon transcriptional repressor